uniref:Leucine-rich repeat protein n=1 Tax=Neobodo designis TaxID=312471 RepID=A0A7S1LXT0_NEODS|mmetsp:Transcript_30277/g.93403  ORF Transcript_30277/g.93403 Transcript_30277/m.93403 type:complete len:401 (+) Transcript_30277:98-1300(+)
MQLLDLSPSVLVEAVGAMRAMEQAAFRGTCQTLRDAVALAAHPESPIECTVAWSVVSREERVREPCSFPGFWGGGVAMASDVHIAMHFTSSRVGADIVADVTTAMITREPPPGGLRAVTRLDLVGTAPPGQCHIDAPLATWPNVTTFDTRHFRSRGPVVLPRMAMWRSESLVAVDLSGLRDLVAFGDGCFSWCTALKELDLSPLRGLCEIGNGCFSNCAALQSVRFPAEWTPTARERTLAIGDDCFQSCGSLRAVSLPIAGPQALPRACIVGQRFAVRCTSMTELDLSGLSILRFGSMFATHSKNLTSVDLSRCSSPRVVVGSLFLTDCPKLQHVEAPPTGAVANAVRHAFSMLHRDEEVSSTESDSSEHDSRRLQTSADSMSEPMSSWNSADDRALSDE